MIAGSTDLTLAELCAWLRTDRTVSVGTTVLWREPRRLSLTLKNGYATYKQLGNRQDGATLAFCWSHVRRGFYDVAKGGPAPVATEALARIAALYRIETTIGGKDAAHRQAVRDVESRKLVEDLRAWFGLQMTRLPARGPIAEAIRYALNHWRGLVRFLEDGRIDLDTQPA